MPDVLTAEALVAKEGLELAVECGVYKTILEVDCSELKMVLCSQIMARDHQSAVFVSISRSSASAVFVSISQRWVGVVAILELLGSVGMPHSCDCVGSDRGSVWMPVILGHA